MNTTHTAAMTKAINEAKQFNATHDYSVNIYKVGFDSYVISACEVEGGVVVW